MDHRWPQRWNWWPPMFRDHSGDGFFLGRRRMRPQISCSMLNQTKHQFLGFLLLQNTCHCLMAVEIWDLIVCVSSARLNWYPRFRCNLSFLFFSQDMFQGVRAGFQCSRHRWAPQCSTSNRRVWKLLRVASFWVSDLMFKNVSKSQLLVETVSKAFAFWKVYYVS